MKDRVSRCNGIKIPIVEYSAIAKRVFKDILPQLRAQFLIDARDPSLWQGEVLCGRRVMNDGDVLMTLQSWATEEQFMDEPFSWVLDALQDCAERDFLMAEKLDDERRNESALTLYDEVDTEYDPSNGPSEHV